MLTDSVIGIDVGGTKCAGGVVSPSDGRIWARRMQPTLPARGGEPLFADVVAMAGSLFEEAARAGAAPTCAGVGVAELVGKHQEILSAATIPWQGLAVQARLQSALSLPVRIEADVRAAARAEAALGAGRDLDSFVLVTIGTGISACLVVDGEPYAGHRGLTGTFASGRGLIPGRFDELVGGPPLENFAAGPALATRFADRRREFSGTAIEVLALAETGDLEARYVVESAARALGAAVAQLVNTLDPAAVVVGGGLGLAGGLYRTEWERSLREYVWSELHREVPVRSAELGTDAGWIGAALAAWRVLPENT